MVIADDHHREDAKPVPVTLSLQVVEPATGARRHALGHAELRERSGQLPRPRHRLALRYELHEQSLSLADVVLGGNRQIEGFDKIARRLQRRPPHHVALERPIEGLAVSADGDLRRLRVETLRIEQHPIHIEDHVTRRTLKPPARFHLMPPSFSGELTSSARNPLRDGDARFQRRPKRSMIQSLSPRDRRRGSGPGPDPRPIARLP